MHVERRPQPATPTTVMAVPNEFVQILNELNRDVARARPADTLQFCANWFNHRLERERSALLRRRASPSPLAVPTPTAPAGTAAPDSPTSASLFPSQSLFGAPSHVGSPPAPPSVPTPGGITFRNSWDSNASTESADEEPEQQLPQLNPALLDLRRRTSVSAESLPVHSVPPAIPHIPKTDEQMARLREAVQNHFLFNNLDEEQYHAVLLAMKEVEVPAQKAVIEQGQEGDYFYVVGSGSLEVYKRPSAEEGSISSAGSADLEHGTGGKVSSADFGEKVASYGPSDSFGELALMYAQPRAASVVSTSPCTLWAMDRVTFRTILLDSALRRRQLFDSFLKEVPLFEQMRSEERAKLADALQITFYKPGDRPVVQGEKGREFFIIIQGSAEVRKHKTSTAGTPTGAHPVFPDISEEDEITVSRLGRGDYFGELALLYNTPRAASVVVSSPAGLKVAKLSEKQFTRLLGPLTGIMSRNAKERYGRSSATPPVVYEPNQEVGPDDLPSAEVPTSTATGTWLTSSPFA